MTWPVGGGYLDIFPTSLILPLDLLKVCSLKKKPTHTNAELNKPGKRKRKQNRKCLIMIEHVLVISHAFCKCPVFIFSDFHLVMPLLIGFIFYFNHYKPSSSCFIGKAINKNVQPLSQLENSATRVLLYIFLHWFLLQLNLSQE